MVPRCVEALRGALEASGATLDYDGWRPTITADAKPGYVWCCNGCTTIDVPFENGAGQRWLARACRELLADARMGMRIAEAEEIGEIEHLRDERWRSAPGSPAHIEVQRHAPGARPAV